MESLEIGQESKIVAAEKDAHVPLSKASNLTFDGWEKGGTARLTHPTHLGDAKTYLQEWSEKGGWRTYTNGEK